MKSPEPKQVNLLSKPIKSGGERKTCTRKSRGSGPSIRRPFISPRYQKVSIRTTQANLKRWKDLAFRKKMTIILSKSVKNKWKNLEYREFMVKNAKKQWRNLEYRQKTLKRIRLASIKNWRNPEYRKKKVIAIKKLWQNPKYRKKMLAVLRIENRIRWKDPVYQNKMATVRYKIQQQTRKGPNGFEKRVQSFLDSSSRIKFKFVGAGKDAILINNYSPDFINKRKKIIILPCGHYWHLKKYGIPIDSIHKRKHEKIKAAPFKAAGYRVIFVWDDEFKREVENGRFKRRIIRVIKSKIKRE